MHRQYLHLGARTISYFDSSPADRAARVVVLIHAFPLGAAMWEGQPAALPPGWRLVAPDMRGFGGSSIDDPDNDPTIGDYATDVLDLLRELDVTAPVIGGLSMGGYVAFAILGRRPSAASAVILADTRAGADTPEGREKRRAMLALLEREGPMGVAHDMLPKLLGQTTLDERPTVAPLVRQLIKQQPPEAIRGAILRMMDRPDALEVVQGLSVPTLIIVGDEDGLTPVEESRRMAAACAASELVVIPRCGHLPNLELPEEFNGALRAFLARL